MNATGRCNHPLGWSENLPVRCARPAGHDGQHRTVFEKEASEDRGEMSLIERCPACGDESASPPAEVFCVHCATEDYAITEQRLKVRRLEAQLAGAVAALQEIRRDCGKVCENFELCAHVACQSSVAAWMIADKALTELKDGRT